MSRGRAFSKIFVIPAKAGTDFRATRALSALTLTLSKGERCTAPVQAETRFNKLSVSAWM